MTLLNTLLQLYPRAWQARYKEEFTALLEQNHFSLVDVLDIALGALDAHLRPQVTAAQVKSERKSLMNRSTLTKGSGIAGMAGSILTFIGFVGSQVLTNGKNTYAYDGFDVAAALLFVLGIVLSLLFALGLSLVYARKLGVLGQVGLLAAIAGLASMAIGGASRLVEVINKADNGGWWTFFILGLVGTLAGAAIFSLAGIMRKALPSVGRKLTALGGFAGLVTLLLSMSFFSDTAFDAVKIGVALASSVCLVTFYLGLFLLGYGLWYERAVMTGPAPIEPAAIG